VKIEPSVPTTYAFPPGGLPPQHHEPLGRAVFTEAYAVIPAEVQTDIVTSFLPGWEQARAWILARPLTGFAETAPPLLGPDTPVIFAQNGIPWWYDIGLGTDRPKPPDLTPLDPTGALHRAIAPERIVGRVVYSANEVTAPGVIRNNTPHRNNLTIGEPDDSPSERVTEIRRTLEAANIGSPVVADIRANLWNKLLLNMTASILSLITGHRVTVVRDDARIGPTFLRLAAEAVCVAQAHGIDVGGFDAEKARKNMPHHFPSIRQDYDRRKALEVDSLIVLPVEFGRAAGLDIPCLEMLAALAVRKARDIDEGIAGRDWEGAN